MQEPASRIGFGLVLLVLLWIGVYWFWPAEQPAPISFADTGRPSAPHTGASGNLQTPAGPRGESTRPAIDPPPTGERPIPPAPQQPRTTSPAPDGGRGPGPIAVIPPQFVEHVIEPGETFRTISVKYFGTSAHASAVARANPLMSPTSLRPGRVIRVPVDPRNIQGLPVEAADVQSGGTAEYVVQRGDTLSKIASVVYGDSRLADHIFRANRDTMADMHSLRIGQKLRIPPKPAPTNP
ncbi:MAG: LysM peptidoglycan-binding domain-containing protein [Phycisphaeraceae bacterium]|nr:LysM peptidoglycan-binding domain-containing protein [Phycisphaeraceae bacterium]